MHNHQPHSPLQAVCHANPYPYYNMLLAGPALYFDPELKLWIASRASVVEEVLTNPHCAVRPTAEPVPKALAGSSAGDVFSQLIRMNEGARHQAPKHALQLALRSVDLSTIAQRTRHFAEVLANTHALSNGEAMTAWMHELPVYVVADALGFEEHALPHIASWMADFVRCLSPLSDEMQLNAASVAADRLLQEFRRLLQTGSLHQTSLTYRICQEAKLAGWDQLDALLANLIGLLSQTYEASAGLIGNSIVQLHRQVALLAELRADSSLMGALVAEVSRLDPPVQNTRRFVTQATSIADVQLQAGDAILLLLAAANRDPAANPAADEFIFQRKDLRLYGFGHGRHLCPGQSIATNIATHALQYLLDSGLNMQEPALQWAYRPSLNGRIPLFNHLHEAP